MPIDRRFLVVWSNPGDVWGEVPDLMWREPVVDALWVPYDEEDWYTYYRPTTRQKAFKYVIRQNLKAIRKSTQFEVWHAVAELSEERDRHGESYMQLGVGEFAMNIVYSFDLVVPNDADRALLPELA
jgi:hypothetical protein